MKYQNIFYKLINKLRNLYFTLIVYIYVSSYDETMNMIVIGAVSIFTLLIVMNTVFHFTIQLYYVLI